MINYSKYSNIIFDFDGVILNSNNIKKECIGYVTRNYLSNYKHKEFVDFFVSNNGVPREVKISKFFDKKQSYNILNSYSCLLEEKLKFAKLTAGVEDFLKICNSVQINMYVVSGGAETEVVFIMRRKKIISFFKKIKGGPKNKEENISSLKLIGETLFIGDSKKDYEVSVLNNFDFIFMHGYTQFIEWKNYFKNKNKINFIKDFIELTNCNY